MTWLLAHQSQTLQVWAGKVDTQGLPSDGSAHHLMRDQTCSSHWMSIAKGGMVPLCSKYLTQWLKKVGSTNQSLSRSWLQVLRQVRLMVTWLSKNLLPSSLGFKQTKQSSNWRLPILAMAMICVYFSFLWIKTSASNPLVDGIQLATAATGLTTRSITTLETMSWTVIPFMKRSLKKRVMRQRIQKRLSRIKPMLKRLKQSREVPLRISHSLTQKVQYSESLKRSLLKIQNTS